MALNIDGFPWIISAAMALCLALYVLRYRNIPPDRYVPAAAWLRASVYFCCCFLVAWFSGALPAALAAPVATAEQLADPVWRVSVFGLFLLITIGYWVIWARFTIRFERRLELLPQLVFGLVWGLAAGFLFLSFWHMVRAAGPGMPTWAVWVISYLIISIWQWLWQDYGWDVYISPEHDCPWSIAVKVPATHIPNVTACLIFYAVYGNAWIFVGLQVWALVGASIAMRMPSPWCADKTLPARRVPGLFGAAWTRAAGYNSPEPRKDIYLRSTGLPAITAIWVLGAHLFATLCPLLMLVVVRRNIDYLETVMYAPQLLYVAALLMILGGAVEISQNSFAHHGYFTGREPGALETVFGTLACLSMATMITACYGQHLPVVFLAYGMAIAYPVLYLNNIGRGVARASLGIALIVAMYYSLGDPVVFLSFIAVFFAAYFYQLLRITRAQSLHGCFASVSAFGMLTIPMAIHNTASGEMVALWQVFACNGLLLAAAAALWPQLKRLRPTPNAHARVQLAATA